MCAPLSLLQTIAPPVKSCHLPSSGASSCDFSGAPSGPVGPPDCTYLSKLMPETVLSPPWVAILVSSAAPDMCAAPWAAADVVVMDAAQVLSLSSSLLQPVAS